MTVGADEQHAELMIDAIAGKKSSDVTASLLGMSECWFKLERPRYLIALCAWLSLLSAVLAATASSGGVASETQSSTSATIARSAGPITEEEEQPLRDLWAATIKNSPVLQLLIKQTFHQLDEKAHSKLLEVIDDVIADKRRSPFGGAILSLTDPNLEPSYPVPGGQAAPYLLPRRAKENPSPLYRQYSIASKHQDVLSSSGQPDKTVRGFANELVRLYCRYRDWSQLLAEAQTQVHPNSPSTMDSLLQQRENYRKQLVLLAGAQAVDQLDQQLGIRR
jgi:hypothetical protein